MGIRFPSALECTTANNNVKSRFPNHRFFYINFGKREEFIWVKQKIWSNPTGADALSILTMRKFQFFPISLIIFPIFLRFSLPYFQILSKLDNLTLRNRNFHFVSDPGLLYLYADSFMSSAFNIERSRGLEYAYKSKYWYILLTLFCSFRQWI